MFSSNSKIGIAFYTTDNIPRTNYFHKFVMHLMGCIGHRYGHVEAQDRNFRHWGIYSGQGIHTQEERKRFDSKGKYSYYTIVVKNSQYNKFFEFFSKNKKESSFNYSIYLAFTTFNMGSKSFFCSQLIAEALLYAGIYSRLKWPESYKITPDILFSLMKDDLVLGNSNQTDLCYKMSNNDDDVIIQINNN